ncbi:MAG: glycerophosphodiester phosphodiesterase family protein [Flavobacterium sp.]
MLKIGHRGAKGYIAENTLTSFEKAIELHVDAIELDVHLSSDSEVMVIHDATIDRTTNKKGFVSEYSSKELKELGIPTLEDVLHLVNQKCIINIEIKEANTTQKVLHLIDTFTHEFLWNYNRFQISSFHWNVLKEVAATNSKIALGVLTEYSIEEALDFATKIKAHSVNPHFKLLDQKKVSLIHANGLKIYTWTVNSLKDIIFIKSLAVDGIISDFPDRL